MGIDLALTRISRLLRVLGNPHISSYKSIHVAGTNGKGSTVAYISSILTAASIRNGRFTSPHLLYYNDCISINNETYPLGKFEEVSALVKKENATHNIGCTQFELLTVTAFKIFELERVEYAVIEVGLGGRLDATNVLEPYKEGQGPQNGGVILCGITKIGIDHESFLGSTFSQIASEKAGIIKDGIPCVVDATNNKEVLDVVREKTKSTASDLFCVDGVSTPTSALNNFSKFNVAEIESLRSRSPLKGKYQLQNLSVALKLIELLTEKYTPSITKGIIEEGISQVVWPGRLQSITYKDVPMLIDGAHNESAAQELKSYLDTYRGQKGLIFIVALSKGKSIDNLLKYVGNRHTDSIIACQFSRPDGMPWVSAAKVETIQEAAKCRFKDILESTNEQTVESVLDTVVAMKQAGDTRKVVVCGSLYLCSDVLRLVNSN